MLFHCGWEKKVTAHFERQEAQYRYYKKNPISQTVNSSHYSHFITGFPLEPPSSLPSPRSPLTCSDSLIGAQLTGFPLGEQEPCGPSASSRRMNRCPAPRRLLAPHRGSPTQQHATCSALCIFCLHKINLMSFCRFS